MIKYLKGQCNDKYSHKGKRPGIDSGLEKEFEAGDASHFMGTMN